MSLHSITSLISQPSASSLLTLVGLVIAGVALLYLLAQQSPTRIVTVGLVAEMFSGHWQNLHIPGPVDHFLLAFGLVSMLLGGRRMLCDRKLVLRPVHLAVLAIATWACANAIWAGTFTSHDGFFALLDRLGLFPFIFFVLAPLLWGDARRRSLLLAALVAMGLYLGLTALLEGVGLVRFTFPTYISNPDVGILFGRARGPYVEADADGLGLIATGVAAGIALTIWRRRWPRRLAIVVIVLNGLGVIFTLTRAVWVAGAIAAIIGVVGTPRLRRLGVPLLLGGALLIVATIAFVPGLQGKVNSRANSAPSLWDRYNTNRAALSAVEQHPITGIGWQRFESEGIQYLREAGTYPLTGEYLEVHNVFLSHAAELGLPGTALWTFALLSAVGGGVLRRGPPELRPWRLGLLAYASAFIVDANFGPLSYPQANLLLWVMAGIACTGYLSRPMTDDAREHPDQLLDLQLAGR